MRYDADRRRGGSRSPVAKPPDRSSRPRRKSLLGYGCHCIHCSRFGGRLGQSRRHDQEGGVSIVGERVHGEDDEIPAIKTVAPDLPLDVLRNMNIRVAPWSAPTLAPPNALRICPANARTSGADVSRSDVRSYEGLGPCRRHRIATRARICSADFDTYACGGFEDSAKIARLLGRVVPLAAAPSRRAGSKSKHSQVPVLRPRDRAHRERDAPHTPQRQGKRPGCCTELASTFRPLPACPPPGR
jgi:hypothetical protein